jgi:ribonucleotide monophosphatase NagD (HAD superfamily)
VFLVSDGDATDDMDGLTLVERATDADVVVLGGASEDFSYPVMNDVFRRLMDGIPLIAMHRNLYWKTARGWELDAGAYIAGLEAAAARSGRVRKPSAAYGAALSFGPPATAIWRRHRQRRGGRAAAG